MISSSEVAPYLQDAMITRREGRLVIPVKADFKGHVPGVVHDRSSSGVTLFVEPLAVVEMNNAVREGRLAEEEEVNRILAALTGQVAHAADAIEGSLLALGELDLTFAKARYAEEIMASEPELLPIPEKAPAGGEDNFHPGSVLRLRGARHPLLDPGRVVAIDVDLDEQTHIAVITGPNTGGKTVTLKTVGLMALMAQAGLHIPVDPGSAISFFETIYADIGDEQSIEQSLSTFSAHLANMLSFLEETGPRSLVLLDELGAGTDPAEGSALARALMEEFRHRRVTGLVATHYPELKLYAHATSGVINASMEFDPETLSPTYRLTIGLPGRSNAFAIARRLGMPEAIVKEAQAMVSGESLRAEDMLADLHELRIQTAQARDDARQARRESEMTALKLRERLSGIEKERREVLDRARREADQELELVRDEMRRLRQRLSNVPQPEVRQVLEEVQSSVSAAEELVHQKIEPAPVEELPLPEPIAGAPRVGDTVRLRTLGLQGTLVSLESGGAVVQAGPARMRVAVEDLELVQRRRARNDEGETVFVPARGPSPGLQLDLRGLTGEEALERLERYLDEAGRAELPWVRVVHGKGTGTLRREVRRYLHTHPLVVSYEAAAEGEGGEGATVVHLVTGS
jgi:DNA mismatch repair protein MutS2